MIKTRTAEIVVEEDPAGAIVVVRVLPDVLQSLDDARANLEACIGAVGNRRSRLRVDIRSAGLLPADVRRYYSGEKVTEAFSALALLVAASPVGRAMGNLYLSVARLDLPTRLFSEE